MSNIRVSPVESRSDLKRFIAFPYELYKDDRYWIPVLRIDQEKILNPKKNAFFEHGKIRPFIATDSTGNVVGRIAGIVNGAHLAKYQDGTGFFGFFEVEHDYAVAEALLDSACEWVDQQGLTAVRGPTNPSMNDVAGLLVNGFDRYPAVLMPYNKPYYADFLESYGFERVMTMWAYYIHLKYRNIDRLRRGAEIVKRRNPGLKLRTLEMSRFEEDARLILDIYNDAWSDNWGHVSMTDNEFDQLVKEMKMVVDPRVVFLLELDGEPIGFSLMIPDINVWFKDLRDGRLFPTGIFRLLVNKFFAPIHEGRTAMMGVRKEHQGKGYDALLNLAALEIPSGADYFASEMSWILDSNKAMVNAAQGVGGVRDKEYAMYEKRLSSS
jgi:GNAT superfamily N-acetyltransferase